MPVTILSGAVSASLKALYQQDVASTSLALLPTKKEFEGDYTLTVFGFTRFSQKGPEPTATEIGEYLKSHNPDLVSGFNVIKGFLNVLIADAYWMEPLTREPGVQASTGKSIMIEYSSPNTNKPLHLGHVRNNLLGHSISEILKALGNSVIKVNLVNDRGVHICKSMLAWKLFANGETPASSGMKGDKLVGKYYVIFDKELKKETATLIAGGMNEEDAEKKSSLMQQVHEMLRLWEAGDKDTLALWSTMNGWVYDGFAVTYKSLGITFDKIYYESQTYLNGKKIIEEGVNRSIFVRRDDGSIFIDLTAEGLGEKTLLRADGTSVYMTQDIGTAEIRSDEFDPDRMMYVVANEQDYHFKVLKIIAQKMHRRWAEGLFHFSYGMVDLPTGKMKSREGTVVDADDLIDEMISEAKRLTTELGKVEGLDEAGAESLFRMLGLGALKYFMLKVDPRKRMLFDPKESIDFNGHTGPFIQYTHARIRSMLRKGAGLGFTPDAGPAIRNAYVPQPKEKELLKFLTRFNWALSEAGNELNPSVLANYVYDLAKNFNSFYKEIPVLKESDATILRFRLRIAEFTAMRIAECMRLLGIGTPERM